MSKFYGAIDLIGGGSGALDEIDGAALAEGNGAVVITDGAAYFYRLDATSAASEDSPYTISPDNNAGDKRWILQSIAGIQGELGVNYATREYVDMALGAFKTFFLSDTASDVGALDYAYPQETGEGEEEEVSGALPENDNQLIKGWISEVGELH